MDNVIEKINRYIENNLKCEFSLADISAYAGYSAYHLSREYKRLTGRSLMDYIRERKILEAANSIANGESILETALVYGFDTHAGFTRAFSEVIGCSPQEYQTMPAIFFCFIRKTLPLCSSVRISFSASMRFHSVLSVTGNLIPC